MQVVPEDLLDGMVEEAGEVHKRYQGLALAKSISNFKAWIAENSAPKDIGALYTWSAKATPSPQLPHEGWCSVQPMRSYTPLQMAAKRTEFCKGYWCRHAKLQQVKHALALTRRVA